MEPFAGVHHPDSLAVLVAEERDRPFGLRLGAGQLLGPYGHVGQDLGIDEVFHLVELGPGHRRVVGEVETQPVRGHQRTLLLDVLAEHLPQSPVEQVGPGVVAPDGRPPFGIDRGPSLLAGRDEALFDHGEMAVQARQCRGRVQHLSPAGDGRNGARIADLPARFGIKGRAVEENLHLPSVSSASITASTLRLTLERAVTDERRRPELLHELPVGSRGWRRRPRFALSPPSRDCTRWRSMALAKPASSTLAPRPGRNLAGQLDREPVSVVQLERRLPADQHPAGQLGLEQAPCRSAGWSGSAPPPGPPPRRRSRRSWPGRGRRPP